MTDKEKEAIEYFDKLIYGKPFSFVTSDTELEKYLKIYVKLFKKQDKIIDLMAEELLLHDYKNFNTPNEIVEYFEKAVKQYFEKEASKDES